MLQIRRALQCLEAKRRILRARESPAVTQLTALINALVCFPPSAPGCCDMLRDPVAGLQAAFFLVSCDHPDL